MLVLMTGIVLSVNGLAQAATITISDTQTWSDFAEGGFGANDTLHIVAGGNLTITGRTGIAEGRHVIVEAGGVFTTDARLDMDSLGKITMNGGEFHSNVDFKFPDSSGQQDVEIWLHGGLMVCSNVESRTDRGSILYVGGGVLRTGGISTNAMHDPDNPTAWTILPIPPYAEVEIVDIGEDSKEVSASIPYAAYNPDPADESKAVPDEAGGDLHILMTFTAGYGATTHTAYFSTVEQDVIDGSAAALIGSPPYPGTYPTGYYVGLDDPLVPEHARVPLVRGTTYYWRVDESNGTNTYPGDVWSYTVASEAAWDPIPADGAGNVIGTPELSLSWQMGDVDDDEYAISYDVFFGTDEATVEAATTPDAHVTDPTHIVGPLPGETDHFWRVDTILTETAPPFDTITVPGDVWQFTTIRAVPIVDENLVAWWKLDGDADPGIAFDSSGYAHHGTLNGDPQWVAAGHDGGALEFDGTGDYVNIDGYKGVSGAQAFSVTAWINSTTNASIVSWGTDSDGQRMGFRLNSEALRFEFGGGNVAANTQVTDGEWHHVAMTVPGNGTLGDVILYVEGVDDMGVANNPANLFNLGSTMDVSIGRRATDNDRYYNGMIDDVRIYNKTLSDKEIKILSGRVGASNPDPANGAIDVSRTPTLNWTPGAYPADIGGNILYYGEDLSAVLARTVTGVPLDDPPYAPLVTLDLGATFYWAVDTVNGMETWPGDLWSFTTIGWISIDDMESYTPWTTAGNNIFDAYRDGMGNCSAGNGNDTGSNLTENADPVFEGVQSMKYDYDNDGLVFNPCTLSQAPRAFRYSRIEAQIAGLISGIGTDWTIQGVKALSLRFYGSAINVVEPMWVQLQDGAKGYGTKVTYGDYADEDPTAITEESWHEWFIDLADLGVDASNLVSISIGFGNEDGTGPNGSGTVYFDDIRLYTPKCFPARHSAAMAKFDYTGPAGVPDCVVDYHELDVMADYWLLKEPHVIGSVIHEWDGAVQDPPQRTQAGGWTVGNFMFSDRTYTWTSVSPEIEGAEYIRTFNDDGDHSNSSYTVTFPTGATVLLACDDRYAPDQQAEVDSIVSAFAAAGEFTDTGWDAQTSEGTTQTLSVFSAPVGPGTYVFGAPGGTYNMYVIGALEAPDAPDNGVINFEDYAELLNHWMEEALYPLE